MSRTLRNALAAVPLTLFFAACTDAAKAPAEAAMQAAASAVDSLKGDAAKFAPESVKAVEASYAQAKALMAKEDYKGALAAAGEIPGKAKQALADAAAKKDELVKAWSDLQASLPNMVAALKSRIGILSQAKKLPAGLDKAALEKAKAGLASIESGWDKATAQFKGGDLSGAVSAAKDLKTKAADLMKSIGLQ